MITACLIFVVLEFRDMEASPEEVKQFRVLPCHLPVVCFRERTTLAFFHISTPLMRGLILLLNC